MKLSPIKNTISKDITADYHRDLNELNGKFNELKDIVVNINCLMSVEKRKANEKNKTMDRDHSQDSSLAQLDKNTINILLPDTRNEYQISDKKLIHNSS